MFGSEEHLGCLERKFVQLSKVLLLCASRSLDSTNMTDEDGESTSGPNRATKFATLILHAFKSITLEQWWCSGNWAHERYNQLFWLLSQNTHIFVILLMLLHDLLLPLFFDYFIDIKKKVRFCENFKSF